MIDVSKESLEAAMGTISRHLGLDDTHTPYGVAQAALRAISRGEGGKHKPECRNHLDALARHAKIDHLRPSDEIYNELVGIIRLSIGAPDIDKILEPLRAEVYSDGDAQSSNPAHVISDAIMALQVWRSAAKTGERELKDRRDQLAEIRTRCEIAIGNVDSHRVLDVVVEALQHLHHYRAEAESLGRIKRLANTATGTDDHTAIEAVERLLSERENLMEAEAAQRRRGDNAHDRAERLEKKLSRKRDELSKLRALAISNQHAGRKLAEAAVSILSALTGPERKEEE